MLNPNDRQAYHSSPVGNLGRLAERYMRADRPEGFLHALNECTAQDWKQIHAFSLSVQDKAKAEAWDRWVTALLDRRLGLLRVAVKASDVSALHEQWAQVTPAVTPWEAEELLQVAHQADVSDVVRAAIWPHLAPEDGVPFLMAHPVLAGPLENAQAWRVWQRAEEAQRAPLAAQLFQGCFLTAHGDWREGWAHHADQAAAWGRAAIDLPLVSQAAVAALVVRAYRDPHPDVMQWLDTQLGLSFETLVTAWLPRQRGLIEDMGPLRHLPVAQRQHLLRAGEHHGVALPVVQAGLRLDQCSEGPPLTERRRRRS